MKRLFVVIALVFLIVPVLEASAHSMFNSAEQTIGGYRVQIATLPEFPQIGEKSQVLFRVTDLDLNEVDRFTMGARIFFNDEQIDAFPIQTHEGGHYTQDYVFERPGNHIVKVDLYNMENEEGTITYTFNMSTQSPFGYVFIISITMGASIFAIVVGYIYLPKKLGFKSKSS